MSGIKIQVAPLNLSCRIAMPPESVIVYPDAAWDDNRKTHDGPVNRRKNRPPRSVGSTTSVAAEAGRNDLHQRRPQPSAYPASCC
jgi:hypothetical protein